MRFALCHGNEGHRQASLLPLWDVFKFSAVPVSGGGEYLEHAQRGSI